MITKYFLALFLISLGLTNEALAGAITVDVSKSAFVVSKVGNDNVVHYDVNVLDDCKIDVHKPLRIYWVMESGKTEKLNLFEGLFYGVEKSTVSQNQIRIEIKALLHYRINFPITISLKSSNNCELITEAPSLNSTRLMRQISVRLIDFKGMTPQRAVITGLYENNEIAHEIIDISEK